MTGLFIFIGIVGWILAMSLGAGVLNEIWIVEGLNFLRPDIIYHNTKLNYFGTGVLFLVLNLFFLPVALCY